MAATVDRPAGEPERVVTGASAPIAPDPPALRILARADGLELLGPVSGSGYRDGAALVRRADGQMVQLGPLMYALLDCADGECDREAIAAAMTERLKRRVEPEHVDALAEKLAAQGLLGGSEHNAPERANPLLALRWKVLVSDPKVTSRITRPFVHLFRPWILFPVLAGFLAVAWFVLIHKGVASATAQAFSNPELLLLVLVLGVASAGFHEIGHASACRYGGGRPGGMGAGIYMVWPAFYTDVTDAYRLPRRARLRTDLGGLYFNALIAVVTLGVWLAVRADALLLLIALQMLEMAKQLSPVIRSDGYHILADATGVPDLYAHIGPTLRRLIPGREREPSALTGKARALVTVWVLVVVPVLLSMALSAILLLPKLAASTYASGSHIVSAIPDQTFFPLLASLVRLLALTLPIIGSVLLVQRLGTSGFRKARDWSAGSPPRRGMAVLVAAGLAALLAWAWWPSGQYTPVRPGDRGTLVAATQLLAAPANAVRPQPVVAGVSLAPGRHLAVALIPQGGPTKQHPAIFVIRGAKGQKPAILVTDHTPRVAGTPRFKPPGGTSGSSSGTSTATAPTAAATPSATPAAQTPSSPVPAVALPFTLPDKPGPHDSQALAVNTTDGGIKYDVVYSLVTVSDGSTVDQENSAYALASCKACTTVAVSFQLVLIVGQSDVIKPINVAEALNVNCPYCITTAIADQIVVTLKALPPAELLQRLTDELKQLDAIKAGGGSPADVASEVTDVQQQIEQDLRDSGLLTNPPADAATPTPTPTAGASPTPSATPAADATPGATPADGGTQGDPAPGTSTPTPTPTATPADTPAPSPSPETTSP